MVQNFESKLISASNDEIFKAAKSLLKSDKLICLYRNGINILNAIYLEKSRYEHAEIVIGPEPQGKCSCGECGNVLCAHVIAGIMQLGRLKLNHEIKTVAEDVAKYAGLKHENFSTMMQNTIEEQHAELIIHAESAFPHVPSKWENAVIVVKMHVENKEYVGNLNNLRQLHFSKTLSVSLKLNYFSLHDRQIIRFLTVNSEQDGAKLLLDSEQTAEFFHCLVDYQRFYKDGRRVIIHRENAEAVMLCVNRGLEFVLSPALIVQGSILPLSAAKVITGRSGCWVGNDGEYWWVPGTVEVSWLRNFLRNGEQRINTNDSKAISEIKEKFPVEIIEFGQDIHLNVKSCVLWLSGGFNREKKFVLHVRFNYEGNLYRVDESRSTNSNGRFWMRDEKYEKGVVEELKLFGFIANSKDDSSFILDDIEAAGIFLDHIIPQWQQHKDVVFSSVLASLCSGGHGVPAISFSCNATEPQGEMFPLTYSLTYGTVSMHWQQAVTMFRENKKYYLFDSCNFVRLDRNLSEFIGKVNDIVQNVEKSSSTLNVPRCALHYWVFIGQDVPGAVPALFYSHDFFGLKPTFCSSNDNVGGYRFAGTLRQYQIDGVNWMRQLTDSNFNVILADEMGLGKTVQTLCLLSERLNERSAPALIICPASLVENWKREAEKFISGIRVAALSGAGRQDTWNQSGDYGIIIISYSSARRDIEFIQNIHFSYLILDEAQHIKNPDTVNAKICKSIRSDHRLVLTGTPLENSPDDLWSIFDYLHPGLLGVYNNFKKYYNNIGSNKKLMDDLAARVAPFIKRRNKSLVCQELPPKQEQILYCEMEPVQRLLYDSILENGRRQCEEALRTGNATANFEILTTLLRLRQVCCHPGLLPAGNDSIECPSAKMELLKELVLQNIDSNHKMLIFSQFTSLLAIIRTWLELENIQFEYLDGATKNRLQHVDKFNADASIPVFLLSLKAGGVGLNLTSADTVIIYDPWWNPAVELQATDRTHRIGQTKLVNSMKLVVKDSIEEKILLMQARKQVIFDNIIENPVAYGEKMNIEELRFLFQR